MTDTTTPSTSARSSVPALLLALILTASCSDDAAEGWKVGEESGEESGETSGEESASCPDICRDGVCRIDAVIPQPHLVDVRFTLGGEPLEPYSRIIFHPTEPAASVGSTDLSLSYTGVPDDPQRGLVYPGLYDVRLFQYRLYRRSGSDVPVLLPPFDRVVEEGLVVDGPVSRTFEIFPDGLARVVGTFRVDGRSDAIANGDVSVILIASAVPAGGTPAEARSFRHSFYPDSDRYEFLPDQRRWSLRSWLHVKGERDAEPAVTIVAPLMEARQFEGHEEVVADLDLARVPVTIAFDELDPALAGGPGAWPRGQVYLVDHEAGLEVSFALPDASDQAVRVPPGTYDAFFRPRLGGERGEASFPLPAAEAVELTSGAELRLSPRKATLSGAVVLDGAPPNDDEELTVFRTGDEGGEEEEVRVTNLEGGFTVHMPPGRFGGRVRLTSSRDGFHAERHLDLGPLDLTAAAPTRVDLVAETATLSGRLTIDGEPAGEDETWTMLLHSSDDGLADGWTGYYEVDVTGAAFEIPVVKGSYEVAIYHPDLTPGHPGVTYTYARTPRPWYDVGRVDLSDDATFPVDLRTYRLVGDIAVGGGPVPELRYGSPDAYLGLRPSGELPASQTALLHGLQSGDTTFDLRVLPGVYDITFRAMSLGRDEEMPDQDFHLGRCVRIGPPGER